MCENKRRCEKEKIKKAAVWDRKRQAEKMIKVEEAVDDCLICMEEMAGRRKKRLPCGHSFHSACIKVGLVKFVQLQHNFF